MSILTLNKLALDLVARDFSDGHAASNGGPTKTARALAIIHLAAHDAYAAVAQGALTPLLPGLPPAPAKLASDDATATTALLSAGLRAATQLYPDSASFIADAATALINSADPKALVYGDLVGDAWINARKGDGSGAPQSDTLYDTAPGRHRHDPLNPNQQTLGRTWGFVRLFALNSVAADAPLMPPPMLDSAEYAAAYDDVFENGRNDIAARSASYRQHAAIGTFWGYDGSYNQPAAIEQPLTITDGLGKVTHLRYDAQGNTVGLTDALGNETDFTYAITNDPLQTILPATGQTGSGRGGSQTGYLYSEPSTFATSQWPSGTLQYGPSASATSYDEGNIGAMQQVVYIYGAEGELSQISGSTEPVNYTYDACYRLKTLTDAANNTTSYFYNPAGYLLQIVYPGAQSTPPTAPLAMGAKDTLAFPAYDADGNRIARVDGNNITTTYTYADPESLLTSISYPTGTVGNVILTYDAYGRHTGVTDGTGSQSYAHDDVDALITKTVTWANLAAKTITYGFYPDGSTSNMIVAGSIFSYSYDGVGRMTSLTNSYGETSSWSYRDNGWPQAKTLANGVTTTYTSNPQGSLRDLTNKTGGGSNLSEFAVPATGGYDGVGNRLSLTASITGAPASYSGTTSYTYDYGHSPNPRLNRSHLTGETSTRGSYANAFLYDGGTAGGPGNPTSFKGVARTYNTNSQQTGTGYGYDGVGNPTLYKSQSLGFDPENRMTACGTAQTDGYSGDGLRTWKQNSGVRTYFLYDGFQPVGEYDGNGNFLASNTFGADGLVSRHNAAGTTFYAFDERGNVTQRLSSNAAVQSNDLYDAYGTRTSTAGNDVWGFEAQSGYYTDAETGLILCTRRFYDPQNGRFLTRDPIGYNGGVNLYGYTGNNPISGTDADGTSCTPQEEKTLNATVYAACRVPQRRCLQTDDEEAIKKKMALSLLCLIARMERRRRCSNEPVFQDKVHMDEENKAAKTIADCKKIHEKLCFRGGPMPIPIRVGKPIVTYDPIPQPCECDDGDTIIRVVPR